jgi:hypothetical protein
MLEIIAEVLMVIVCVLYISRRWKEAEQKRFVEEALDPFGGIEIGKKRKAIFWYLFK